MDIVKVGVVGVLGTLLAIQFKSGKSEYGVYISVGISIIIFFSMISRLKVIVDTFQQIGSYIRVDGSYITTMLKMLGVAYVAEFASGICKDAGYQTIASQIEVFSKLTILVLGMPVLLALMETIRAFLT